MPVSDVAREAGIGIRTDEAKKKNWRNAMLTLGEYLTRRSPPGRAGSPAGARLPPSAQAQVSIRVPCEPDCA